MPTIDKEILELDLQLDSSGAVRGIKNWGTAVSKAMANVSGQTAKMDRLSTGMFKKTLTGWHQYQNEVKRAQDITKLWGAKTDAAMGRLLANIEKQRRALAGASEEDAAKHEKAIKRMQEKVEGLQRVRAQTEEMADMAISVKVEEMGKELRAELEGLGADIAAPFSAAMSKDIPGAIKAGAKWLDKGIQKTFMGLGRKTGRWGQLLQSKGGALGSLGQAKGGSLMGKGMEGMGAAMKGIGGIVGKMGPMIQTLASLGPILSMAAGAVAAIVKLMIDAESQAKEFQKELLASASTGEFLARAGGNANLAYADLKDTVTDVRNSAFDLQTNLDWGMTSKDHLAFRNVLNQEGVSIARLKDEFDKAREAGQVTGDAVKYYAEQTATAVAFGRMFGVQLGEIGQLQGELMANMGQSFESVNKDFAIMAQQASESGMAMNKFYAIMKGVSQDLSSYNMRMDQASRLLAKLGKAMNPRTAQQFMQTLSRGFKDMGRLEKLRMTLLAGQGKVKAELDKDQKQKMANLSKEMGERIKGGSVEAKRLLEAYVKGGKGAGRELSKALEGVEGGGAMREAATRMKMDRKAMSKGLFGISQAIGDVGPSAMIEIQKAALGRFAKPGATLSDMIGELGPEMMAENLGISQEQLKQMAMLEETMNETRADLVDQAMKDQGITEEQAKKQVDAMTDDEILQKAGVKDAASLLKTEKDFAKQQTELTQSLMDKLQVLIDFLMNELYNVMTSIWDGIIDVWYALKVTGGDEYRRKKLEVVTARTKDPAMMALLNKAGGGPEAFKKALNESDQAKAVDSNIGLAAVAAAAPKRLAEIQDELSDEAKARRKVESGQEYAAQYEAKLLEEQKMLQEAQQKGGPAAKAFEQLDKALRKRGESGMAEALGSATQDAGLPGKKGESAFNVGEALAVMMSRRDMTLTEAMKERGFTEEQMQRVLENLPVDVRAAMLAGTSTGKPGAPGTPPPSAQRPDAAPGAPTPSPAATATGGAPGATPLTTAIGDQGPEMVASSLGVSQDQLATMAAAEEGNLPLQEGQLATQQEIVDAMRQKGIRLDKTFTKSQIVPAFEEAFYKAGQKFMYEYWLYSAQPEDVERVLKWAKEQGVDIKDSAAVIKKVVEKTEEGEGVSPFGATEAKPNATGGMVTGVVGGMAHVRPAPGEGLASVGPGERILPAGSGAGPGSRNTLAITVDVSGQQGADFNRYLENAIRNAIYDYESRKRLT